MSWCCAILTRSHAHQAMNQISLRHTVKKKSVDFTVKYRQLAVSAFTVKFTGDCRTSVGITS